MRLPVNLLLYLTSVGLFGLAGYTFYLALQEGAREVHEAAYKKGIAEADDLMARGKGQGPVTSNWNYDPTAWGERFRRPNLVGKEPKAAAPESVTPTVATPTVDQRPLDEIIDLVSLMSDTSSNGEGGESKAVIRYRPDVDVQPPTWYLLENQSPSAPSVPVSAPGDAVPGRGRPTRPLPRPNQPPPSAMPSSSAGREILQTVVAAGDGSPRNEATLWPPFQDVRLVRVMPHGLSAWFRRPGPVGADGSPGAPVEEEVILSAMDYPAEVKKAILELKLKGSQATPVAARPKAAVEPSQWQEFEETRVIGNTVHISRNDHRVMQASPETFLDRINVDPYVSRSSGTRGLLVVNIAGDVATRFGIQQNDLLIAINNEPVSSRADAMAVGRRLYDRGVRTFVAKFLSQGRPIERTYTLPDR